MLIADRDGTIYQCQDINTLKIHPFHVSRLKPFNSAQTDPGDYLALASVDVSEYVVEDIIDHRIEHGGLIFRVRWRDYGPGDDSWLPLRELRDVVALRAYALAHPELDI